MNITNEDNMELMARYEDNYFDLAIVDPPYGIGMDNSKKRTKPDRPNSYTSAYKDERYHKTNWDNEIPSEEYFKELFRVSKNQIIWGANYMCKYMPNGKGWIYWNKNNGDNNNFSDGEFAFSSKGVQSRHFKVSAFDNLRGGKDRIHPTQKPVKLYEWLLMNYATCKTCKNEGGYYEDVAGDGGSQMWVHCDDCDTHERPVKILDTHLGSGSIAIACHNLGFDLTACELDTEYYNAAMKRLKQHQQQLTMF